MAFGRAPLPPAPHLVRCMGLPFAKAVRQAIPLEPDA